MKRDEVGNLELRGYNIFWAAQPAMLSPQCLRGNTSIIVAEKNTSQNFNFLDLKSGICEVTSLVLSYLFLMRESPAPLRLLAAQIKSVGAQRGNQKFYMTYLEVGGRYTCC